MTNKLLIDNKQTLINTLKYLENPPAVAALGEKVYGLIGKAKRKKRMLYGPDGATEPHRRA
jgi:flagellar biosynthesis/type III secretory pathway chaperone